MTRTTTRTERMRAVIDKMTALRDKPNLTKADEAEFERLDAEFSKLNAGSVLERLERGDIKFEAGAAGGDVVSGAGSSQRDRARRVVDAAHRSGDLPDH